MNDTKAIMAMPSGQIAIRPGTFDEAWRFATLIFKSGMAVKGDTPETVMAKIIMGSEVGLSPMQAVQNIAVINGRPSLWGDAMLGLVRAHPEFDGIAEAFTGQGDTLEAVCIIHRKGGKVERCFSVNDAKRAKLWNKPGPWQDYPRRMLQMRARGFACRDAFPDALRGLQSAEESGDIIEINPKKAGSDSYHIFHSIPTPEPVKQPQNEPVVDDQEADGYLAGLETENEPTAVPEARNDVPQGDPVFAPPMGSFPIEIQELIRTFTPINQLYDRLCRGFELLATSENAVYSAWRRWEKDYRQKVETAAQELAITFILDEFWAAAEKAGKIQKSWLQHLRIIGSPHLK